MHPDLMDPREEHHRIAGPLPDAPEPCAVGAADQCARFVEDVPAGEPPVLSRRAFEDWARRYIASDPEAGARMPPAVKIPTGPFLEIGRAWHGTFPYDPASVRAPVCIIRGEWDGLATDADARWLFERFTRSPDRRDVKVGRGTHLLHLETMRSALWGESIAFLGGGPAAARSGGEASCSR